MDSELHAKVAAGEAGGKNAPNPSAFLETMPKLRRKRNLLQSTNNVVKAVDCPAECKRNPIQLQVQENCFVDKHISRCLWMRSFLPGIQPLWGTENCVCNIRVLFSIVSFLCIWI